MLQDLMDGIAYLVGAVSVLIFQLLLPPLISGALLGVSVAYFAKFLGVVGKGLRISLAVLSVFFVVYASIALAESNPNSLDNFLRNLFHLPEHSGKTPWWELFKIWEIVFPTSFTCTVLWRDVQNIHSRRTGKKFSVG